MNSEVGFSADRRTPLKLSLQFTFILQMLLLLLGKLQRRVLTFLSSLTRLLRHTLPLLQGGYRRFIAVNQSQLSFDRQTPCFFLLLRQPLHLLRCRNFFLFRYTQPLLSRNACLQGCLRFRSKRCMLHHLRLQFLLAHQTLLFLLGQLIVH